MMFADVANEWAERHFKTVTYGTAKSYRAPLERLKVYFSDRCIEDIKPLNISDFVGDLVNQNLSYKTVKNHYLVANMIFDYAVLCDCITINPCKCVKLPRNLRKGKRRIPTPQEIELVKACISYPFGLFAYFILYTGLRKGEAIALQYKDIDCDNKLIHVTKSSYYESNQAIIKKPKTENGYRDVFLLDLLAYRLPFGIPNHYVFSNSDKPLTAKKFIVLWRNYCNDVGIKITPHQLRHAYATILFESGIDVKDAQDLLGHSSICVTRDIYTHISKRRKSETFQKLNDFV